jgi:hypothetical protein
MKRCLLSPDVNGAKYAVFGVLICASSDKSKRGALYWVVPSNTARFALARSTMTCIHASHNHEQQLMIGRMQPFYARKST